MYRCTRCNSKEVESLTWVDMNTLEEVDGEVGEYFCRACQSHTDVIFIDDETIIDDESNGMDATIGVP